jgi:hypothetical protein
MYCLGCCCVTDSPMTTALLCSCCRCVTRSTRQQQQQNSRSTRQQRVLQARLLLLQYQLPSRQEGPPALGLTALWPAQSDAGVYNAQRVMLLVVCGHKFCYKSVVEVLHAFDTECHSLAVHLRQGWGFLHPPEP